MAQPFQQATDPPSLKPKPRLLLPCLTLTILCAVLFYYFHPLALPNLHSLFLPPCGHIVLISAARHGSSWFLNSAEQCVSSASFHSLNRHSELWNLAHNGPLREVSPLQAVEYVQSKHSIKIFPLAYYGNETELTRFLELANEREIPVFVLTRRLEDSFRSHEVAVATNNWNTNVAHAEGEVEDGVDVQTEMSRSYEDRMTRYFNAMRNLLMERDMMWDEFDYDDVVNERVIVGRRNQCILRNCNFL